MSRNLTHLVTKLGTTQAKVAALPARVFSLLAEADGVLLQGESWEATRDLVRGALKTKLAVPDDDYDFWLRDIYNGNQAIYERDGKCYQVSFVLDAEKNVTFGEAKQVTVAYVPVGESRSAELAVEYVPLVEKALRPDGTLPIKLIQPGWGSSGYYGPEVLERDGPAAFPAGTKMYLDHPTESEAAERPERSVRDLAAVTTSEAKWNANGIDGPGLYADAKAIEAYQPFIEELSPHIGLSIRTAGALGWGEADGRSGAIVEKIVHGPGTSIDFVTEPGAGGKVLQLFESARQRARTPQEADMDPKDMDALKESNAKLAKDLEDTNRELARQREANTLREAQDIARAQLATTSLPEITQERMVPDLAKRVPLKEGAIDQDAFKTLIESAAKNEGDYLAKLGAGRITGMGDSQPADISEADREKKRTERFQRLGMSESEAKVAAAGRA